MTTYRAERVERARAGVALVGIGLVLWTVGRPNVAWAEAGTERAAPERRRDRSWLSRQRRRIAARIAPGVERYRRAIAPANAEGRRAGGAKGRLADIARSFTKLRQRIAWKVGGYERDVPRFLDHKSLELSSVGSLGEKTVWALRDAERNVLAVTQEGYKGRVTADVMTRAEADGAQEKATRLPLDKVTKAWLVEKLDAGGAELGGRFERESLLPALEKQAKLPRAETGKTSGDLRRAIARRLAPGIESVVSGETGLRRKIDDLRQRTAWKIGGYAAETPAGMEIDRGSLSHFTHVEQQRDLDRAKNPSEDISRMWSVADERYVGLSIVQKVDVATNEATAPATLELFNERGPAGDYREVEAPLDKVTKRWALEALIAGGARKAPKRELDELVEVLRGR